MTLLGNLWSPMRNSAPDHNNLPRAHDFLDALTFGLLEGVFVGKDAFVRRLAPGS